MASIHERQRRKEEEQKLSRQPVAHLSTSGESSNSPQLLKMNGFRTTPNAPSPINDDGGKKEDSGPSEYDFKITMDAHLAILLERASRLVSDSQHSMESKQSINNTQAKSSDAGKIATNHRQYRLTYQHDSAINGTKRLTPTQEKMLEYHELVTAFHSEQQNDGQGNISREDVLWFFEELKWRFEEIQCEYEKERIVNEVVIHSRKEEEDKGEEAQTDHIGNHNLQEWRRCLIDLMNVVNEAKIRASYSASSINEKTAAEHCNITTKSKTARIATIPEPSAPIVNSPLDDRVGGPGTGRPSQKHTTSNLSPSATCNTQTSASSPRSTIATISQSAQGEMNSYRNFQNSQDSSPDKRMLQKEIINLKQRLDTLSSLHHDTCRSFYDDIEVMKRDHNDQIFQHSKTISNLQSDLSQRQEMISLLEDERQKEKKWLEEEKNKLELKKEGMSARIRYLEGIVRSLQAELKGNNTQKINTSAREQADNHSASYSKAPKKHSSPIAPVFLRDLPISPKENNIQSTFEDNVGENDTTKPLKNSANTSLTVAGTPNTHIESVTISSMQNRIDQMQSDIQSLSESLARSENERANLLEKIQVEREGYMDKYEQMHGLLRQFLEMESHFEEV